MLNAMNDVLKNLHKSLALISLALFALVFCSKLSAQGPPNLCEIAAPFCTNVQGGVTFPASTNSADAQIGPDYGCLFTQPNPAWYYLQIATAGPIEISMFSTPSEDIDFIIWGPFNSLAGVCAPGALNFLNIVDCSYSTASTEVGLIPNAQVGEFYMFLITNYSNQQTNINFNQTGGTGATDCSVLCDISGITLNVGTCDPATNLYNITGTVNFTNAPTVGNLVVTNSLGGSVNLPVGGTSQNFSFTGLTSDGASGSITATFSDDATCTFTANFTAPAACSQCAVTASFTSACSGGTISLTATPTGALPGATYSWTGPNGFTSNVQNPTIPAATAANDGTYTVTLTSGVCSSTSSVNVAVIPIPATPVVQNSGPVCENGTLNLTTPAVAGATYNWTGPNSYTSTSQNPTVNPVALTNAGQYSLTITVSGCTSAAGTTNVVVNVAPVAPTVTSNSPICEGAALQINSTPNLLPGQTISWTGPAGFTSNLQNPTIASGALINIGTYSAVVTQNGCSSIPSTIDVLIVPTPETPIINSNSPVCQFTPLNLSAQAYAFPVTYAWVGPNGFTSTSPTVNISSVQPTDAGLYSLVVTVQNTTCSSAAGSSQVVVNQAPQANAGADIQVCPGVSGNIGSPATPGAVYLWSPVSGLSDFTAANPIVNLPNLSGSDLTINYIVTASQNGCISRDTVVVTVFQQPVAAFTAPNPQCFAGNSFSFVAGGQFPANSTFLWNFGANASPSTSTQQNPAGVTFGSTGNQPISLIINANGCPSNMATANVTVLTMPVANFTADKFEGCDPMYVRFTNLSETLTGNLTYQWDLGNNTSSTATNPTSIYSVPGTYNVRLKVTASNGCTDAYIINGMITVRPTPEAGFVITPGQNLTIMDPVVSFEDFSVGATVCEYEIGNIDVLFDFNPKYTFPDTGVYVINQIVSNQFGCSDTMTKFITVDFGFKIFFPKAFSPNNDGRNDIFKAYGEDVNDFELRIFNRWGQLLFTTYDFTSGWDGTIRNTGRLLSNDVYLYTAKGTDKYGRQFESTGTVNLIK